MVANLGHDSSKEHLGEGGGQIHLEQLLEGENPLAPLSAAGACKFNPACCRARKRLDGEAEARLGILARICLHLEPTAADPTPFPLDAAHFVQPSALAQRGEAAAVASAAGGAALAQEAGPLLTCAGLLRAAFPAPPPGFAVQHHTPSRPAAGQHSLWTYLYVQEIPGTHAVPCPSTLDELRSLPWCCASERLRYSPADNQTARRYLPDLYSRLP